MLFKFQSGEETFSCHKYGLNAINKALQEARYKGSLTGKMTVHEVVTMKVHLARMGGFKDKDVLQHLNIVHAFQNFLRRAADGGQSLTLNGT